MARDALSGAPEAAADAAGREVAAQYYATALDEARRCIAEEIAAPADVDLAMRHGCGWETGPLEWARSTEAPSGD